MCAINILKTNKIKQKNAFPERPKKMNYDFTVYSMTAHPSGTTVSSRISDAGYMASADLEFVTPAGEIQASTSIKADITNIWSGVSTGTKLLADSSGGLFGFTFSDSALSVMQRSGVAADGALIIYFASVGPTSPSTTQYITIQIEMQPTCASGVCPPTTPASGGSYARFNPNFNALPPPAVGSISVNALGVATPTQPQGTLLTFNLTGDIQLFAVQLTTAANSNFKLKSIMATSATMGMQAFSCPFAPQAKLVFPTLRGRIMPTRDSHTSFDGGAITLTNAALHATKKGFHASKPRAAKQPQYIVTRFGALPSTRNPLVIQKSLHYFTADTSVSSASLVNKVRLHKPPQHVAASTTQMHWKNASVLAAPSFTVDEKGVTAQKLTLFFTPITFQGSDGQPTLIATTTNITVWGIDPTIPTTAPLFLGVPNGVPMLSDAGGWTLAPYSGAGPIGVLTLTAPAATGVDALLLPYVELTYYDPTTLPPLLKTVDSSDFPIQAFTADMMLPALATDVQSPCFNFQEVTAASVVLFTDASGNSYKFGDGDATFTMSNAALDVAMATASPQLLFNGLQLPSEALRGNFFTEKRLTAAATWLLVDDVTPVASEYGATLYSFKEYVPKKGEYGTKNPATPPTSVILLFAQNVKSDGSATESGYVSCCTATTTPFAATAFDSTTPLLDLQTAVKQEIQWGVVQANVDLTTTPRGVSQQMQAPRSLGLVYVDVNMKSPMPLTLAVAPASSVSTVNVAEASSPVLTPAGLARKWIAHGVWNTADSIMAKLLYNPATMLVEPMDLHNIVAGTGFTEANTQMQWIPRKPVYDPLNTATTTSSSIAKARIAAATAAATTARAAAMINQIGSAGTTGTVASILYNVTLLSEVAQTQSSIASNASRTLTALNAAAAANTALTAAYAAVAPIMTVQKDGSLSLKSSTPVVVKKPKKNIWTTPVLAGILVAIVVVCLLSILLTRIKTRAA